MNESGVSIVMSCYNASGTVVRAIDSMLCQTFSNFEFIIVDDGSADDTLAILKQYERKDDRIVIIENDLNIGLAASLNKAIERARSKYIARMDADDESIHDRLEKQINFLRENEKIDVLGTAIYNRTADLKVGEQRSLAELHHDIVASVFKKPLVFHPTIMIKKKVYTDFGYYDPDVTWAEDADLWYRIYDKVKFHNLQEPLLYYTLKKQFKWRHAKNNIKVKLDHLIKRNKLIAYTPQLIYDVLNFSRKMISTPK